MLSKYSIYNIYLDLDLDLDFPQHYSRARHICISSRASSRQSLSTPYSQYILYSTTLLCLLACLLACTAPAPLLADAYIIYCKQASKPWLVGLGASRKTRCPDQRPPLPPSSLSLFCRQVSKNKHNCRW